MNKETLGNICRS